MNVVPPLGPGQEDLPLIISFHKSRHQKESYECPSVAQLSKPYFQCLGPCPTVPGLTSRAFSRTSLIKLNGDIVCVLVCLNDSQAVPGILRTIGQKTEVECANLSTYTQWRPIWCRM
jgi:hypothetical protein